MFVGAKGLAPSGANPGYGLIFCHGLEHINMQVYLRHVHDELKMCFNRYT